MIKDIQINKDYKIPKYIDNITPLRGIAAIMVLLFHVNEYTQLFRYEKVISGHLFGNIINKGYLWVDFFFIISGFIIYHVYGKAIASGNRREFGVKYKRYMVARFARIYPLHLLVLFLLVFFELIIFFKAGNTWAFNGNNQLSAIPGEFFLLNSFNFFDWLNWNIVSWSIGAEWYTYFIAPFIFVLMFKKRNLFTWLACLLFLLLGLIVLVYYSKENTLNVTSDFGFLRCVLGFFSGAVLYKIYEYEIARRLLSKNVFFFLSIAGVILCVSFVKLDWAIVPFFWLLIFSVVNNNNINPYLQNKTMVYLGNLSYSIYILQLVPMFIGMFVMYIITGSYKLPVISNTTLWVIIITYPIIVVGLAGITYRFVEKLIRNKIKLKFLND